MLLASRAFRPRPSFEPPPTIGQVSPTPGVIDFSRKPRRRARAAAIVVVALLVVLAFKLFPLQDITLVAGGTTVQVRSAFVDKEVALEAAALDLAPGDRVLVARAGDQAALAVQRATPVVVSADGAAVEVRTRARTVAGALALASIEVGEGDRIYVDGLRTAPGAQLDRSSDGSVSAASTGQPLRIEVVRALPDTPAVDSSPGRLLAETLSPPPAIEALSSGASRSVLVDPLAWRIRESSLPPDGEALALAVAALPKRTLIAVNFGGEFDMLRIGAERVQDVLDHFGIELGEYDRLSHGVDDRVYEGMDLILIKVDKVVEEHSQYNEASMYRRDDHTLAPGEERTVEGIPGEVRVSELVTYENGEEVSREPHSAYVVSEPVAGEYLRGPVAEDGVSPVVVDDYTGPYRERVRVWATWYNATHGWAPPGDPAYGITFSGVPLEYGICAVDPDYIPLGTRFYVPGYGECLAADTGGLIDGYDVDLGFPEGHPLEPWHTGYVYIYILD